MTYNLLLGIGIPLGIVLIALIIIVYEIVKTNIQKRKWQKRVEQDKADRARELRTFNERPRSEYFDRLKARIENCPIEHIKVDSIYEGSVYADVGDDLSYDCCDWRFKGTEVPLDYGEAHFLYNIAKNIVYENQEEIQRKLLEDL